jgi:hypothetical protein
VTKDLRPFLAARALVAVAALGASGCATTESATLRELPVGMSSLGALLDGCAPEAGADGVTRLRCSDGLVLSLRSRSAGTSEPLYRAEAWGMAQLAGARLVWDQTIVATEGPSGLVDRARALEPGTDAHRGTLIGTVRSTHGGEVQEVWCTAGDDPGAARCAELVGAVLGIDEARAAATAARGAAAAPGGAAAGPAEGNAEGNAEAVPEGEPDGVAAALVRAVPPPPRPSGPVTVFGRALSLPTTCRAKAVADGGDASCSDGTSLSWRRFDDMQEAARGVEATLAALGESEASTPYGCTIVGEAAQCAEHEHAVAGLTYVDGKAVTVLCVGPRATRDHSLCKALLHPVSPK